MSHVVLSPAYGRDYRSKREVEADFNEGKDFIIENVMDRYCGKPASKEELRRAGYTSAELRYAKLTKLTVVRL